MTINDLEHGKDTLLGALWVDVLQALQILQKRFYLTSLLLQE